MFSESVFVMRIFLVLNNLKRETDFDFDVIIWFVNYFSYFGVDIEYRFLILRMAIKMFKWIWKIPAKEELIVLLFIIKFCGNYSELNKWWSKFMNVWFKGENMCGVFKWKKRKLKILYQNCLCILDNPNFFGYIFKLRKWINSPWFAASWSFWIYWCSLKVKKDFLKKYKKHYFWIFYHWGHFIYTFLPMAIFI